MTTNEFKRILLEGLRQTQATRATFYRHQAKEKDIEPVIFLNGLQLEYKGLLKIVKDIIPDELKPYSEGYGNPLRNTIDIFRTFGIKVNVVLNYDNIVKLLGEPLNEFKNKIAKKKPELKQNQIALIHVYNEIPITRENANEIAIKNGYTSKNSGEKIYQLFTYFTPTDRRKGEPKSPNREKMENKIILFESVLPFLTDKGQQRAATDIKILRTNLENEY